MNEFKQQVLEAIDKHPGFTTNDYFEDMLLDKSDKPKLARSLSELKKDGYVSSVMGEDKLLCWSLTQQGAEYVTENSKGLKFDVIPQVQHELNDDPVFSDDGYELRGGDIVSYSVITKDAEIMRGNRSYQEAIDLAKKHGGGTIMEVKTKAYATVEPVTTYKVTRL